MKKTKILYWIFTILLAALMGIGAIPSIMSSPGSVALVCTHLGYPTYLLPFIGVAKLLGVIAILIPGFPRIKEWAYAGLTIDLAGAMYSTISVGDPASVWWTFFIGFLLIACSYIFYHKMIKQPALSSAR